MPKRKGRIIIDTNLWISFLLTNNFLKLDKLFAEESIVLLFSEELLEEFIEVASRSKFKKYFSLQLLESLLGQIRSRAEFIPVTSVVDLCRDPKDNFLLSLAIDGNADFLITGDKDLLELKQIDNTKILTFTEFHSL